MPNRVLSLAPGHIVRPKYDNIFKRPIVIQNGTTPLINFDMGSKITDGHFIVYTLPQYGKALEEFVEHGTFTIDGIDYISHYNSGAVNLLESSPYYNVLRLIFNYEFFETRHEGVKFRASKINGVSNAPFVPKLIQIYRQLTLYGYKVEIPFSSDDINIFTRKYVIADGETAMHVSLCFEELKATTSGIAFNAKVKAIINEICSAADKLLEQYTTRGIVINNSFESDGLVRRVGYDTIINLSFNHSNGSTADTDRESRYTQRRLFGIPYDSAIFHSADSFDILRRISSSDTAKLTFVPKDSRGPRTICMEPAYMGFIQQMYMKLLYEVLPQVTKNCIDLENQDNNRFLALIASSSSDFATIDLSSASDSIMSLHIRELFPPRWVDILEKCRTVSVLLPDGSTLRPQKFAPMGSALCFPIECIIFYAIAKAVVDDGSILSVYGDDIIVPKHFAEPVMSMLEKYGFTVNRKKSFYKSGFRESCGIFAFEGNDVSCIYRRDIIADVDHYNEILSKYSSDIAPQSFIRMPNTEGCINREPTSGELIRYLNGGSFVWDVYLHRVCVLVRVHRSRHTGEVLPDEFAYSEWLRLYSGKDNSYLEKARAIARRQESDTIVMKYVPTDLPYSELGYAHQISEIFKVFGYVFDLSMIDQEQFQSINKMKGVRYVRFKKPKETKKTKKVEQSTIKSDKESSARRKPKAPTTKGEPKKSKTRVDNKTNRSKFGTKGKSIPSGIKASSKSKNNTRTKE